MIGGELTRAVFHDDFNYITSSENLFLSWEKFRRDKRHKPDVAWFERNLESNIFELQAMLKSRQYKHDTYLPFTIYDPKQRQISKATVADRVVHQALVQATEPLFEQRFIYDSYSCRKNKGTHAALNRLRTMLRRESKNNTRTVYGLKLDIRKFFASVDHNILYGLVTKQVTDSKTQRLLQQIICSFETQSGKGIPLGNLTSQLFANIYLHELDWFMKHTLQVKNYIRYCDDFVIVSRYREALVELVDLVETFVSHALKLHIHPNKVYVRSWHQGIDFLGYVVKLNCTVLRTKTKKRMIARVEESNLSSYLGLCSHASTYELQSQIRNCVFLDPRFCLG